MVECVSSANEELDVGGGCREEAVVQLVGLRAAGGLQPPHKQSE